MNSADGLIRIYVACEAQQMTKGDGNLEKIWAQERDVSLDWLGLVTKTDVWVKV